MGLPSPCRAEEWSRQGTGEVFVFSSVLNGDTVGASGVEIGLDDTTVAGLGLGFNYNEYINLNMDMFFGSTDIVGRGLGVTVEGDSNLYGIDINLDCSILKSRFTPMVSAGIGFIRFDGDVKGFDFDVTDFSYNVGVGFR